MWMVLLNICCAFVSAFNLYDIIAVILSTQKQQIVQSNYNFIGT